VDTFDKLRGEREAGATHEIHHGFVGDCELPARIWNM
jgi:hypothetical protein